MTYRKSVPAVLLSCLACAALATCGWMAHAQVQQQLAPSVPEWAQSHFPNTGIGTAKEQGGPVFRIIETLGRWNTESVALRAVWVARDIPSMSAPRGLSEVLLLNDSSDEVLMEWRDATSDDIRFDDRCNALRVFGFPVALTDDSIRILRQSPSLTLRSNADLVASETVKALLAAYLRNGREGIIQPVIRDILEDTQYPYWSDDLPADTLIRPDQARISAALPAQPVKVLLFESFAHDIGIATGMRYSKAWEALVHSEVVGDDGNRVRIEFLVYGDHAVADLVSRVEVMAAYPADQDRIARCTKWESNR